MERIRNYRNVAIVLLIAAAVYILPGGGRAANTVEAVLTCAFAAAFGLVAFRVYRERQMELDGLGTRHRALLYGAFALGLVTIAAKARMWETGLGEFAWFALLGLAVYALIVVYRFSRTY